MLENAHSTRFLNYGHLGTVTYDKEDKRWGTLRTVEPHVASARPADSEEDGRSAFPLRHLSSKIVYDGLAAAQNKVEPETSDSDRDDMNVSSSQVTRITDTSATAEDRSVRKDEFSGSDAFALAEKQSANRSALLAFGNAVSTVGRRVTSEPVCIPIATSVSGSNAQYVRLVRIGKENVNRVDGEDISLHAPSISNEDDAYWASHGGSIQQVCFAAVTGYSSTWMAARLHSSTTIFHPLEHRKSVAPRFETTQSPSEALPSSVLDANLIATIPISRTGGYTHADVSFHPQDHSRLALIDDHGNWSVWLVDGERQETPGAAFCVTLIGLGKIWTWDFEKRLKASSPYHDGWHRISWCISSNNTSDELLVCNRRTAAVYKSSGHLLGLKDLRLGHAQKCQIILDVQWSSLIPGHCFVLTSKRLLLVHVMGIHVGKSGRDQNLPHVLLAWQHFRDRGDRTLHLILLETGLSSVVLIVSRLVDLVSVFRVGLLNDDKRLPVSLADPLPIFLPEHPDRAVPRHCLISSLFRAIESRRDEEVIDGTEYPYLFKLFSLYENLSIAEHLYSSTEAGFGSTGEAALSFTLPLPVHISLRPLRSESTSEGDFSDFVVADNWVKGNGNLTGTDRRGDGRRPTGEKRSAPARLNLDWQDVYAHSTEQSEHSAVNARIKMKALLAQCPDHLHQASPPGKALLSEAISRKLHIIDVDDDLEQFENFISTFNSQQGRDLKLERLPIVPSARSTTGRLTSIYDAIVRTHLTPLSPQTPDRVRVNKERLGRRVTADLLLASTAIFPAPTTRTGDMNQDTVSERATSQPTQASSSSALTTSRPTSTTAATTASPATEEDLIITRLRQYATISPPSAVPLSLSTNPTLTSILRHLPTSPHTHPATYNYRATERTLAAEQQKETAIAASRADPRAWKRAEKARVARERREEIRRRAAEEIKAERSGMPMVVGSQFGTGMATQMGGFGENHGEREVQSSQVKGGPAWDGLAGSSSQGKLAGYGHGQDMPVTQPERGVFGTRPGAAASGGVGKKKKKKKRAAGF